MVVRVIGGTKKAIARAKLSAAVRREKSYVSKIYIPSSGKTTTYVVSNGKKTFVGSEQTSVPTDTKQAAQYYAQKYGSAGVQELASKDTQPRGQANVVTEIDTQQAAEEYAERQQYKELPGPVISRDTQMRAQDTRSFRQKAGDKIRGWGTSLLIFARKTSEERSSYIPSVAEIGQAPFGKFEEEPTALHPFGKYSPEQQEEIQSKVLGTVGGAPETLFRGVVSAGSSIGGITLSLGGSLISQPKATLTAGATAVRSFIWNPTPKLKKFKTTLIKDIASKPPITVAGEYIGFGYAGALTKKFVEKGVVKTQTAFAKNILPESALVAPEVTAGTKTFPLSPGGPKEALSKFKTQKPVPGLGDSPIISGTAGKFGSPFRSKVIIKGKDPVTAGGLYGTPPDPAKAGLSTYFLRLAEASSYKPFSLPNLKNILPKLKPPKAIAISGVTSFERIPMDIIKADITQIKKSGATTKTPEMRLSKEYLGEQVGTQKAFIGPRLESRALGFVGTAETEAVIPAGSILARTGPGFFAQEAVVVGGTKVPIYRFKLTGGADDILGPTPKGKKGRSGSYYLKGKGGFGYGKSLIGEAGVFSGIYKTAKTPSYYKKGGYKSILDYMGSYKGSSYGPGSYKGSSYGPGSYKGSSYGPRGYAGDIPYYPPKPYGGGSYGVPPLDKGGIFAPPRKGGKKPKRGKQKQIFKFKFTPQYKTFASPTAALFNLKASKRQRKKYESTYTGLEVIGLKNGKPRIRI